MKIVKSGMLLVLCWLSSASVFAEICNWSLTNTSISGTNVTAYYTCKHGSVTAATKRVTARYKGDAYCSVNPSSKYRNAGDCKNTNIILKPTTPPRYGEYGWLVGETTDTNEISALIDRAKTVCRSGRARVERPQWSYRILCE